MTLPGRPATADRADGAARARRHVPGIRAGSAACTQWTAGPGAWMSTWGILQPSDDGMGGVGPGEGCRTRDRQGAAGACPAGPGWGMVGLVGPGSQAEGNARRLTRSAYNFLRSMACAVSPGRPRSPVVLREHDLLMHLK